LDQFDRESQTFSHYQSYTPVPVIYEDSTGLLWYGTSVGLFKLDPTTKILTVFKYHPTDPHSLSSDSVTSILEDSQGYLWIGTEDGLNRMDRATEKFDHYLHDPDDPGSLSDNVVTGLLEDRTGRFWIATLSGLNLFNQPQDIFYRIQHDPSDPSSLSDDLVQSLFEDRSGVLWIGTVTGGLNKLSSAYNRFKRFPQNMAGTLPGGSASGQAAPQNLILDSLSGALITDIFEEQEHTLWFGTFYRGLYKVDRETGDFFHYLHNPEDANSLSSNVINSIHVDSSGDYWFATSNGLDMFDPRTETFESIPRFDGKGANEIIEDENGDLWVGSNDGLYHLFRDVNGEITSEFIILDSSKSYNPGVRVIYQDRTGALWVGSYGDGVYVRFPEDDHFTNYSHDPDDPGSLSYYSVFSIHEDKDGKIWLGTFLGGLNRFNRIAGTFTHYSTSDGLAGEWVACIQADDQGNLWLGTNNGLSKFNPENEVFRNYDSWDGLQGGEFYGCGQSQNKEMFFGGLEGLNTFYPGDIQDNLQLPPVVITNFNLFNETVRTDLKPREYIQLPYLENFISFDYAALDFNAPQKNEYAYKLEGLDENWIFVGTRRHAEYPDLKPGEYTFRVKAANNDGFWNESGASARIVIKPPFWQEFWFHGLVTMLLIAAVIVGYKLNVRRIRARSRELETQVEQRTRELKERTTESERRQAELEALYRADEELYRYLHLEHVLHALVDVAVDILQADKGALFVWDEAHEKLVVKVAIGYGQGTIDRMIFLPGDGAIGEVAKTGEPVLIERTVEDPRTANTIIIAEGVHATIQVPIMIGGNVFGVFSTDYTRPHSFADRELRLLIALAQRAALAIENARLYEQAQELAAVEERNRLARDLHDSVTQSLFGATMYADTAQYQLALGEIDEAADSLSKLRSSTRVALGEMRLLIYELRPPILAQEGLAAALEARLETVEQRAGLETKLIIEGVDRLPENIEQQLYSIAIEALNNALKHANAEKITASLRRENRKVELKITDDGIGFDLNTAFESGGLGLKGIQERAAEFGGQLKIDSKPGSGTTIAVILEIEQ
jgi:signal transduction histidine kinase/ligand-binding sensor domain-containing protein